MAASEHDPAHRLWCPGPPGACRHAFGVEPVGNRLEARPLASLPLPAQLVDLVNDKIDPAKLETALPELIGGCTPRAIREHLKLNRPIYPRASVYGHFGRKPGGDGGFSWEKTDLADTLRGMA